MSEVEDAIAKYLKGGDRSGFGARDPFRKWSGGGGVDNVAKTLAAGVTDVDDCPDSDTRYSAQLFGILVGSAKLEPADMTIVFRSSWTWHMRNP